MSRADRIRAIADSVKKKINDPGVGFALFVMFEGQPAYVSNGARADVRASFREWLSKTRPELRGSVDVDELPEHAKARKELENHGAKIGNDLLKMKCPHVALFLFDFGEPRPGSRITWWFNEGGVDWRSTIERFASEGDS